MRILIGLILLAALGWSGYWFWGARALETRIETWFVERQADGWVAEMGDVRVRGFPNRFDATLSEVELADPETGLAWSAPFFQLFALSYRPQEWIAVWPPEQSIATPYERLSIESDDIRASLAVEAGPSLPLDRLTLVATGLTLSSDAGWQFRLPELRLALRRLPQDADSYQIGAEASDLLLPEALRKRLDAGARLPETISRLHLDATAAFDAPWDLRALEQQRPQPRAIDLDDLSARWGALELRAAGDLEVSPSGTPEGEIAVKAQNWRDILALGVASGLVPRAMEGTLERGLNLLGGLSGDRETLDLPLTFAGGRIRLGPIPLGPAPRLILR